MLKVAEPCVAVVLMHKFTSYSQQSKGIKMAEMIPAHISAMQLNAYIALIHQDLLRF